MVEHDASEGHNGPMPLNRLLVRPTRLIDRVPDDLPGHRVLCVVAADQPALSLSKGQELVVILSPDCHEGIDVHDALRESLEDDDLLNFDGVRPLSTGDVPVLTASSSGHTRPSRELAEAAITEFLDAKVGEDTPFDLIEDGDEASGMKCGWAFWVREEDTTSYLHADLNVEWYGTSYEPGQDDEQDEDAFAPGGP